MVIMENESENFDLEQLRQQIKKTANSVCACLKKAKKVTLLATLH